MIGRGRLGRIDMWLGGWVVVMMVGAVELLIEPRYVCLRQRY